VPTVTVVDASGKAVGAVDLRPEVFGGVARVPLVHQSVVRELADRRAGTHSTRGRSEVSGGGRKPWRQKGTGRARQGSIRATQWKGGGKPFGPTPRSYAKRMPAAMRRGALRDALAAQIAAGAVTAVEGLELTVPKTKALLTRLTGFGLKAVPTLLVVSEVDGTLRRAARNVSWLEVERAGSVSVYQLVRHPQILFERAALLRLQEALASSPART
jgi:large subunit ribosomal protein L4